MKNIHDNDGIYRLKCNDFSVHYIGETGRSFKIRYNEHLQAIKNNYAKTGSS
jgi:hypothetical protein